MRVEGVEVIHGKYRGVDVYGDLETIEIVARNWGRTLDGSSEQLRWRFHSELG